MAALALLPLTMHPEIWAEPILSNNTGPENEVTWVRIPPGIAHFFFEKKRKRVVSVKRAAELLPKCLLKKLRG